MRQEQTYEDDVDENGYRGPSKSQLKREQNALQDLGREMTKLGDEQLKRIGLPDEVLVEIVEFRRMRSFGAQRRQLQLIGKKMRNMDPVAVREAIDRVTGESRAAVALLHRCETKCLQATKRSPNSSASIPKPTSRAFARLCVQLARSARHRSRPRAPASFTATFMIFSKSPSASSPKTTRTKNNHQAKGRFR